MENQDNNTKKRMGTEEVAVLLSETLKAISERKIPLSQGMAIARVALALSKTIEVADLNERVEFLEQSLKNRR